MHVVEQYSNSTFRSKTQQQPRTSTLFTNVLDVGIGLLNSRKGYEFGIVLTDRPPSFLQIMPLRKTR